MFEENGKRFFDNLWKYVEVADISSYKWSSIQKDDKEVCVQEIDISEDPDLYMGGYDESEIEKNGEIYKYINWCEEEDCYILKSELKSGWGRFWTVAYWIDELTLQSCGKIYQTKEKAMEATKEDYSEEEILVRYRN